MGRRAVKVLIAIAILGLWELGRGAILLAPPNPPFLSTAGPSAVAQTEPLAATPCVDGFAGLYPCQNVNLLSFVPLANMACGAGNSLWGWTDPMNGKEYALMGCNNGISFVDISDPETPVYLGRLPTRTSNSSWRDVRVYANHAYVISEASGHGMQVFDLTRLRDVVSPPVIFTQDAHYSGFGSCHTIAINEATGFAYGAGSNTCSGGLHMVNIQNPVAPTPAGCVSSDGYTHETQCVVYNGPDTAYQGREICFNSNADTLTIVDVTDKSAPVQLSRTGYVGRGYVHQGWLTENHVFFLLDDELDERNFNHNSRTYIWNVSDLDAPVLIGSYTGPSRAVDHNQYIRGSYAYQANYRSGLRILDITGISSANLAEVAFFDIYPPDDAPNFNGAWNNYPFFPSGNVIVSGIEQGLFVLQPVLDPNPTSLSINDVSVAEGNSGTVNASFTVSLSAVSSQTVTVDYATANGTATAGSDYVATSGPLSFSPGTTTQTVTVTVNGDVLDEPNETFFVDLTNPSNATIADPQGIGTIVDDDGTPSLSIGDTSVTEGNSGTVNASFPVSLSAPSGQTVTVLYATANGTATAGSDYTARTGILSFPPGMTGQTVIVSVIGDLLNEPNETFFVNLSGAINATLEDPQGIGTIIDDDAVTVSAISPSSGPAAGGTNLTITGTSFQPGAGVRIGGVPATGVTVVSDTQITASTPPLSPGTLNDVDVTNPSSPSPARPADPLHPSHVHFLADFLDVPGAHPFHDFIERIFRNGITAGCGEGNYCPDSSVARDQMAIFLLRGKHGGSYMPPAATGTVFNDVPITAFAAAFIEQLYAEGITSGCSVNPPLYCPASPVTRGQMAVFLLRARLGSGYVPPAATGIFGDVPQGDSFAPWIEDLFSRGITSGCSVSPPLYCPNALNTRGQMAVFLTRTFNLPLP